ncbi:MAG: HAD family phosphatase [Ruminococcus flavefaciens]|nr:HAD family phosphatase [Ruminococcus flavefaciens]MCM1229629.1 HAD family phosphatase [Ruminococcus flavefaciens]
MNRTIIKGAVFDMDGLMIDTEKLYLKYWKQAASDFGYTMLDEHVFAIRSLARKYSIPRLKGFFGDDFPTEEIRARRTELINAHIEQHGIDIKPGLFELLDYLKSNGIKLAVATATQRDRTLLYLDKINARSYFNAVICGDMIANGKPEPDIYLTACGQLGLLPCECVAYEDSPNGIKSAFSAGCYTIMIPDMTQPDDEIKPMISAVYESLDKSTDFFEGRI